MRRRRRGFSAGSVFIMLLTLLVLAGSLAFFGLVGRDSPAASMSLSELVDTIGSALQSPLPGQTPRLQPGFGQPSAPPAAATATPQPLSLSLSIGGMVHFDSDITASQSYLDGGQGILAGLKPQLRSDLNILGFDQIISDSPGRRDDLRVQTQALQLMRAAGADALLLPLGRLYDDGLEAANSSITAIKASYMSPLGPAEGAQRSLRVNGINIAWLHLSSRLSREGRQALAAADQASLVMSPDTVELGAQLAELRRSHDLIIVSLNMPLAKGVSPGADQQSTARRLAQLGADMVLGMGGDQVQGLERYQLQDGAGRQRDVLIAYSLGTLLSENRNRRELQAGMVLQLDVSVVPGGGLSIQHLRYHPTFVHKWSENRAQHFALIESSLPAPEGMSKAQRDSMAKAFQLIEDAMGGSGASLQR